ncbi:MAG: outer membrane beta-barrel protein [Alphaproteobacteria bacterium]|nr:outer membrane beta-barrel protein [Alphaproteobacteria bacterium]
MRRWVALVLAAAFWAAAPALAAAPKADFSGAFLGLQTQYGFGAQGDWCGCTFAPPVTDSAGGEGGTLAGLQAGYDWRFGSFVVEAGVRVSYADLGFDRVCAAAARCEGALDWLAEAQLSAGFVIFGDMLLVATAGLAAGDVEAVAGGALKTTATHDGHVFAARAEQAMSHGWRMGVEYRYYEMEGTNRLDTPTSPAADVAIAWSAHVVGVTIANEF